MHAQKEQMLVDSIKKINKQKMIVLRRSSKAKEIEKEGGGEDEGGRVRKWVSLHDNSKLLAMIVRFSLGGFLYKKNLVPKFDES